MTSRPFWAACASIDADQSPHFASSVTTSRMTLLSTSVVISLAACERHDLLGGQAGRGGAAHAADERIAARRAAACRPDTNGIPVDLELDLRLRQEPEP